MKIREIRENLRKRLGEKLAVDLNDDSYEIETLLTDSRDFHTPANTLFFAIDTEGGNDGHRYIVELYKKGVRNFVAQRIPADMPDNSDTNFLLVPDTVEALGIIGSLHSGRAKELVAITGSRGKTTVKEILYQLLEPYKKISRSTRSYNSKIGVPLSLWKIYPDTDIALIEGGISKRGEMENLKNVINPDTVIFTNIGEAHSQGFSSKEEKAREKAILAKGDKVKTVIFSLDDPYLPSVLQDLGSEKELIRWSQKSPEAELFIIKREDGFDYVWKEKRHGIKIRLQKPYDLENLAVALTFLLKEGVSFEDIEQAFSKLQRINTRLNVSDGVNGCSVILDSFTNDLSSLQPAIDFMARRKMPQQSLTLLMSDLRNDGTSSEDFYKEMALIVKENGIKKFIGIGPNLSSFSRLFPEDSIFYKDTVEFFRQFRASDFNDEIILLKGKPEYDFETIYKQLEAKKHETVMEVNLDAMIRNYNYFRSHVPSTTGIIAMVKAFGYGAGSYEIAKTLQDAGAAYLAVAALDEGMDLRKRGITMPIMVMNPRTANYRALFNNRLEPVIYSLPMLETLKDEARKFGHTGYPVHIKLDTGMHRMGFEEKDIDTITTLLKDENLIKVTSIFSHLATADCLDMDDYTLKQLERFEKMSGKIIEELGYSVKRHILNSAGIIRFPGWHYDYVRLGIGLYGANTLPPEIEAPLWPVSSLRSVIIDIREVEEGEAVGYARKGKITGKRKIATVPVGYADGMNRRFGNGAAKMYINGKMAPTIGNICMDATMLDVTGIDCREGDSVEIFGENINVQQLADTLGTIPYEIFTSVSPRVKRVYYRE